MRLTSMIRKSEDQKSSLLSPLSGVLLLSAATLMLAPACQSKKKIIVDGSSTVYPITEAVAESYRSVTQEVNVAVGTSGTGGGFKKFCNKETDISDASRPVKKSEMEKCAAAGVKYIEFPIAYDGIAVVVNPKNTFVKQLTVDQLNHIFRYDDPAKTWKDVNPEWPDRPIKIFAPGQDSGTYDYFVETVIGKKSRVRADSSFSEDDNVLVTGVAGEEYAIGFFGLAYYEENKERLRDIPVVNPASGKPVSPSLVTVKDGSYAPLSRPLFLYVTEGAAARPEVEAFLNFYLDKVPALSKEVGYVPLGNDLYALSKKRFAARTIGSAINEESNKGKSLEETFR